MHCSRRPRLALSSNRPLPKGRRAPRSINRTMSVAPEAAADNSTCVVLGAGSWGTALAIQLARVALPTLLWGRDATHLSDLQRDRRNARYLPDAAFPPQLSIEPDLKRALQASRDVIVAVPSHALRGMLQEIAPHLLPNARVAWATKGRSEER